MSKRRILIFIDWYLPGYKAGGPIQSVANLVEHLKDEYDFSIVTRDTDYIETVPYPNVKSNEWNVLSNGVKVYYFSKDQLTRFNMRNLIRKTEFDHVYLNGIYSLYFTLYPLYYIRKQHDKRIVIAGRGMFARSALTVKKAKKQFFLRVVKILRLFKNVIFHATNENEREEIQGVLGEKIQISIAGNLPPKNNVTKLKSRSKFPDLVRLVNVARIAPEKNLLFALQILKQVKGNVVFDVYGPVYNNDYWKQCLNVIDQLPLNVIVNYKGSIESEKVPALFNNYHFMFMPTRGENFGHVILQSLICGCPVIISDQTPWKNLHKKNVGWDIPLSSLYKYAEAIDFCVHLDQLNYDQMSIASFKFAKQYINNPEIVEQNRNLFL